MAEQPDYLKQAWQDFDIAQDYELPESKRHAGLMVTIHSILTYLEAQQTPAQTPPVTPEPGYQSFVPENWRVTKGDSGGVCIEHIVTGTLHRIAWSQTEPA